MSDHQKRLSVPNSWPVERKTSKFTAKAGAGPHGERGVPLVVVLRDVLGYVDSAREASYAINTSGVLVNGDTVGDINRPIGMFDILAFPDRDEYYRVFPDEGGRLGLTPLDEDAAGSKLGKISDKTTVQGGLTQLNFHDGGNLLVEDDVYSGNDSVVIDNETNEVVAHFEYETDALVTAVDGQHAGEIGHVTDIHVHPGSANNTVAVETADGAFETIEEYVVIIDENFVEEDEADTDIEDTASEDDNGADTEVTDTEDEKEPDTATAETSSGGDVTDDDEAAATVDEPDDAQPADEEGDA